MATLRTSHCRCMSGTTPPGNDTPPLAPLTDCFVPCLTRSSASETGSFEGFIERVEIFVLVYIVVNIDDPIAGAGSAISVESCGPLRVEIRVGPVTRHLRSLAQGSKGVTALLGESYASVEVLPLKKRLSPLA